MSINSESVGEDEWYTALSNPRRRWLISHLIDQRGSVTLRHASRSLAADEHETSPEELSNKEIRSVYISLYSNHIPLLETYSIVRFDQSKGRLYLNNQIEYLPGVMTDAQPKRKLAGYYLISALGFGAVLLADQAELVPMSKSTLSGLAIIASLLLVGFAIIHYYRIYGSRQSKSSLQELGRC